MMLYYRWKALCLWFTAWWGLPAWHHAQKWGIMQRKWTCLDTWPVYLARTRQVAGDRHTTWDSLRKPGIIGTLSTLLKEWDHEAKDCKTKNSEYCDSFSISFCICLLVSIFFSLHSQQTTTKTGPLITPEFPPPPTLKISVFSMPGQRS